MVAKIQITANDLPEISGCQVYSISFVVMSTKSSTTLENITNHVYIGKMKGYINDEDHCILPNVFYIG